MRPTSSELRECVSECLDRDIADFKEHPQRRPVRLARLYLKHAKYYEELHTSSDMDEKCYRTLNRARAFHLARNRCLATA